MDCYVGPARPHRAGSIPSRELLIVIRPLAPFTVRPRQENVVKPVADRAAAVTIPADVIAIRATQRALRLKQATAPATKIVGRPRMAMVTSKRG
jgi:hypothetical protein